LALSRGFERLFSEEAAAALVGALLWKVRKYGFWSGIREIGAI
jgi:hypothetical protein